MEPKQISCDELPRLPEISNPIAAAMVAAWSEIPWLVKTDEINPHYQSAYPSLAAVLSVIRPILAKHQLMLVQTVTRSDGGINVVTIIQHVQGQRVVFAPLYMPVDMSNAQAYGKAETYGRRYALNAIFGLAAFDDDGEGAIPLPSSERKPIMSTTRQPKSSRKTTKTPTAAQRAMEQKGRESIEQATDEQELTELLTNVANHHKAMRLTTAQSHFLDGLIMLKLGKHRTVKEQMAHWELSPEHYDQLLTAIAVAESIEQTHLEGEALFNGHAIEDPDIRATNPLG